MDRSSPTGRGEASLRHGERPGKGGKGNGAGHMQGLAFFEGYGPWGGGGRIAGDREDCEQRAALRVGQRRHAVDDGSGGAEDQALP